MSNPVKKDWLTLPDLILSDIMKMIALESITTLRICTEVCTCTSWKAVDYEQLFINANCKN